MSFQSRHFLAQTWITATLSGNELFYYLLRDFIGASRHKYMWLEARVALQWRAMGDTRSQPFISVPPKFYVEVFRSHQLVHTQIYYSRSLCLPYQFVRRFDW